ncbi:hypothetical protein DFS34DRAFT_596091 [Phlyctochytrium arcticum]|nr:hypothetical protein DFS34DRAFT_596091 [Phlyctochytrium arcticum]
MIPVHMLREGWVEFTPDTKFWNFLSLGINSVNIIANCLLFYLFATDRALRHDYRTYLFLNLAIADFCWGISAWATEVVNAHHGAFSTGVWGCEIVLIIASTGMAVSMQTFMYIAFDRWIVIWLEKSVTKVHIATMSVSTWIVGLIYSGLLHLAGRVSGGSRLASTHTYCEPPWMSKHPAMISIVVFTSCAMVFCTCVPAVCYTMIYAKFRRTSRSVTTGLNHSITSRTTFEPPRRFPFRNPLANKEDTKALTCDMGQSQSNPDEPRSIKGLQMEADQAKEREILLKFIILVALFLFTFMSQPTVRLTPRWTLSIFTPPVVGQSQITEVARGDSGTPDADTCGSRGAENSGPDRYGLMHSTTAHLERHRYFQ